MNTKYNYVFYNVTEECYDPVLWPLEKYPFAKVFRQAFSCGKFTEKLFFLHWSNKLNAKVKLPLKKLWFKKMFCHSFDETKPCCYVFLGGKYLTQTPAVYSYIKKQNPANKAVVLCGDLIAKKSWDIDYVKSLCDMIVTYDEGEAEKYGVCHVPWENGYGAIEEITTPETYENDVYFLGFAKDRLGEIHSAYRKFSEAGLRCKFIVCGTKEEDRISGEGLYYTAPISYRENLHNVIASRCVFELIQGQSCAPTLRFYEAYTYKRRLVTNNANPMYAKTFHKDNLVVCNDWSKVDTDKIRMPVNYSGFGQRDEFSPLGLIEFLENNIDAE